MTGSNNLKIILIAREEVIYSGNSLQLRTSEFLLFCEKISPVKPGQS